MSKKVTAIGFDLDGVLINSLPSMQKAWGEVNSKCDVDTPFAAYESYIGFPFKDILTFLNLSDRYEEIFSIYFDATKKYPVSMHVYGGPGSQQVLDGYDAFNFMNFNYLAQHGYIVACVDNRGTGARGETRGRTAT